MKTGFQVYIKNSIEAVEFYQKAFGATLGYNEKNPDGTYMHAELNLDGQLLLAISETTNDEFVKIMMDSTLYPTMNFGVNLETEEAVRKAYDVLTKGANILLPLGSLPWSSCCANIIDKYGVFWYISV